MTAVETHFLTKIYAKKPAVDRLSLTVDSGECFGLLGLNGAGKSTTVKMLAGLTTPTSGSVSVFGHDIVREAEKARALTAVVPQETAVAANLTVTENLTFMAGVYGKSGSDVPALKAAFGLNAFADVRASTLSGGWQRRLSIAMALAAEPKLLFLDEPTLGLDIMARRELWRQLDTLKGRLTIILTTHDLDEAAALCSRVAIMTQGRLCAVGTPDELIRLSGQDTFEEAFVALSAGGGAAV